MPHQTRVLSATNHTPLQLAEAVEAYVAQGGIINVVPEGETRHSGRDAQDRTAGLDTDAQMGTKIERLKGLVAKGAGVCALQYSLRMNRKDIKRLANEIGLKINYSRPVRGSKIPRRRQSITVDDAVAGHAMHYSSLGYTVPEIAQLLELGVRDIWDIGKAYRFEFNDAPVAGIPGSDNEEHDNAASTDACSGTAPLGNTEEHGLS